MSNESIDAIVDGLVSDLQPELRTSLKAGLLARDEEIADRLRVAAAMNGLMPSFVALTLKLVGMGETPTEAELVLLHQQVAAEQAQLQAQYQEMVRRIREGDSP